MGRLYSAPLASPIGAERGALWGASAARAALSNTSAPKQVRMTKIIVAVQLIARHLKLNRQYNYFAYFCLLRKGLYIHHLVHRGAIRNKTAVRGGGRPSRPPYSAATVWTILGCISLLRCFV